MTVRRATAAGKRAVATRAREERAPVVRSGEPIRYCAVPVVPVRTFAPGTSRARISAIVVTADKWVNGTVIHYYFFDRDTDGEFVHFANGLREWRSWVGAEDQRQAVRAAFKAWKDLGLGLEFEEVDSRSEAELRIGFMEGDGSWSYIGTYALRIGAGERTMNFGWDLTRGQDGADTAMHEIGHALGLPHEHQNPHAGIVWDEEAVYAALAKPPNRWDREKTFHNIIRKIDADTVQGSNWDPDSVMHYPFEAGLISQPAEYASGLYPAGGLSERDKAWVRSFYPPTQGGELAELRLGRSEQLAVRNGEQQDFAIRPNGTRYYNIGTFGSCDTILVLFSGEDGELRYMTADDDSGDERNARLRVKLRKGRRYVLRARVNYSDADSPPTVMMW